jgi:tetratricopeptide (TPR) repeat protein
MARAAVKAKQQARAKAQQPAKARAGAHGRRRHAGGGNPNQELFFVRMRRHQKWVYAMLAVVFMVSFVFVGVGSGSGGLSDLYTGLFGGGGGSSISKAQDEILKNPGKGYRDLATAYEEKGNTAQAIVALNSYLAQKNQDAASWAELGGLQMSQGNTFSTRYQNAQQAAQQADPSAPFLPGGTLGAAVGQNPTYQNASQKAAARTSDLYTKATTAFGEAVKAYKQAAKIQPRNATYLQELATAAVNAGDSKTAVTALKSYLRVYPNAPLKKQIQNEIKALSQGTPTVQSGG